MTQQITPQMRMAYFNQSTRQNFHTMPTVTGGASQTLQMLLPKARLLSKIFMQIDVKVNVKHANEKYALINAHNLIRRISLDLNNGFSPFVVTGYELHLMNMLSIRSKAMELLSNHTHQVSVSPEGDDTNITLFYELPVCMNERDTPQGLILLQNAETNVTLSVDTATGGDIINGDDAGFTCELKEVKITPVTETFSLPAVQEAFPDLSILKLTNGVSHSFMGNGVNSIKLSTGTIYRKLLFIFEDEDGKPMTPEDFTGNLQLVFNQADINYDIPMHMLQKINTMMINFPMPIGVYYLDFSSQGFTNFGGTRDLIDTELLTEFTVKFGTTKRGKVSIVSECIARVK